LSLLAGCWILFWFWGRHIFGVAGFRVGGRLCLSLFSWRHHDLFDEVFRNCDVWAVEV